MALMTSYDLGEVGYQIKKRECAAVDMPIFRNDAPTLQNADKFERTE